ncbi:MAG TPA: peptidase, imelysin family protein, partial [Gammaproteobacteria bacterium]|nr:peptidase, imelysin family protein [Gammaproteobacteria bacterium]
RLSPIDSTNYDSEDGPEGDINAWPLGESLIDYVVEGTDFLAAQTDVLGHGNEEDLNYPTENIINSSVAINDTLISNTATADDEHDVIAGYHAIEFMLWGQDLNADGSADTLNSREALNYDSTRPTGGHRPLTDFTTADNADRRHTYMEVVAAKLVSDLKAVRDEWEVGATTYRTAFTAAADETEAKQKLAEILTGMGTLAEGELAGERMQIAFASNSQEDEHSCFSDNTHRDIVLNAMGILNSYNGEYLGYDSNDDGVPDVTTNAVDGYGLDDYLADVKLTDAAADLKAKLATTKDNYMAIDALARQQGVPVDVQILEATATEPMALTIKSLNAESSSIANLATALGITGDVVDPTGSDCDTSNPTEEC